jgi:predicted ribosomally synthesized peptide with nif11-like leader
MFKEDAKSFIKRINNDKSFREKVLNTENLNEAMNLITQEGFYVTKDIIELATEHFKSQNTKLCSM